MQHAAVATVCMGESFEMLVPAMLDFDAEDNAGGEAGRRIGCVWRLQLVSRVEGDERKAPRLTIIQVCKS